MLEPYPHNHEDNVIGTWRQEDRDTEYSDLFWSQRQSPSRDRRSVVLLAVAMMVQTARDILYESKKQVKFNVKLEQGARIPRSALKDRKRMERHAKDAERWINNPYYGTISFAFCCSLMGIRHIEKARSGFLDRLLDIAAIEMPNTGDAVNPKAPVVTFLDMMARPVAPLSPRDVTTDEKEWMERLKWYQPLLMPEVMDMGRFCVERGKPDPHARGDHRASRRYGKNPGYMVKHQQISMSIQID